MTITRPNSGELVTAAWGQSVADAINPAPLGLVAIRSNNPQLTTSGGTELIVATTPTFNAPANRKYRITADFVVSGSVTADACRFAIRRGNSVTGALVAYPAMNNVSGNQAFPIVVVGYDLTLPANGAAQYCLTFLRTGGTGTFTFNIGGGFTNNLAVEDIGGA